MIARPELNPIKFRKDVIYDFVDDFMINDNMDVCQSYEGTLAVPEFRKWCKNVPISFQIGVFITNVVVVRAYLNGVETALLQTDITPSGWSGQFPYYLNYEFTPDEVGELYFTITDTTLAIDDVYYSDKIEVKESLPDHVLITYNHDANDKGIIFNNNVDFSLTQRIYVKGILKTPVSKSEIATYVDSNGNLIKLNQIQRKGRKLQLINISDAMFIRLGLIFSCTDVKINGISYQTESEFELEEISTSNVYNASVDVYMTNWNKIYDDNVENPLLNLVWTDADGNTFEDANGDAWTQSI